MPQTNPETQSNRYNLWHYVKVLRNQVITPISLTEGTQGNVNLVIESNDTNWSADGSEVLQAAYLLDGSMHLIAGAAQVKADVWDCTGLNDVGSSEYCKVLLTVDDSQTGQIHQGEIAASQSQAPMPFPDEVKNGNQAVFGYIEANDHTWSSANITDSMLNEGIDLD